MAGDRGGRRHRGRSSRRRRGSPPGEGLPPYLGALIAALTDDVDDDDGPDAPASSSAAGAGVPRYESARDVSDDLRVLAERGDASGGVGYGGGVGSSTVRGGKLCLRRDMFYGRGEYLPACACARLFTTARFFPDASSRFVSSFRRDAKTVRVCEIRVPSTVYAPLPSARLRLERRAIPSVGNSTRRPFVRAAAARAPRSPTGGNGDGEEAARRGAAADGDDDDERDRDDGSNAKREKGTASL